MRARRLARADRAPTQLDVALRLVRSRPGSTCGRSWRGSTSPCSPRTANARPGGRRARGLDRARAPRVSAPSSEARIARARGGRALLRRPRGLRRPHDPVPHAHPPEEGVPMNASPLLRTGDDEEIAPGVHVVPDRQVNLVPNVGIVVGDDAVLVVDTGMGPASGRLALEAARRLGGDRPLPDATTSTPSTASAPSPSQARRRSSTTGRRPRSSRRTAGVHRDVQRVRTRGRGAPGRRRDRPAAPDVRGDVTLDLGNRTVELREFGGAHTTATRSSSFRPRGSCSRATSSRIVSSPSSSATSPTLPAWIETRPAGGAGHGHRGARARRGRRARADPVAARLPGRGPGRCRRASGEGRTSRRSPPRWGRRSGRATTPGTTPSGSTSRSATSPRGDRLAGC